MKQEKRVVNIRFLFCVFMGLMLGIISSYLFLVKKLHILMFLLIVFLTISICITSWVYAKKTEPHNLQFKARKNVSFLIKWSGIGFFVAFVMGIILIISPTQNILQMKDYTSEVIVSGEILGR